jgi:putative beta-lysine N-acetyltransferase
MSDIIETLGQSRIQHGSYNDRVYLMKLSRRDLPEILPRLDKLARNRNYSKIFAKVPESAKTPFAREGYVAEAAIPNFYQGREDVVFFGKYLEDERRQEKKKDLVKKVLAAARAKAGEGKVLHLGENFQARATNRGDAEAMAEVYRQVFATYPFPIHDPDYLKKTMDQNVAYFGIWDGNRLVALSSAEMDLSGQNAEMTDFATLPEYRGQGLANFLLAGMEDYLGDKGIKTAYTIARAYSFGMNITFAKLDYEYSGTLTNNTNIFGGLESMNVWHKPLD